LLWEIYLFRNHATISTFTDELGNGLFGNQQILFEKGTLKIHTISNQFYEVLSFFENPKIVENLKFSNFSVSVQAIRELIERKILISST